VPRPLPTELKLVVRSLVNEFPSISTSWSEEDIGNTGQGASVQTRLGRQIRLESCEVNGVLALGSTGASLDDPDDVVRIVVGLYRVSATPLAISGTTINSPITVDWATSGLMVAKFHDEYIPLYAHCPAGTGFAPSLKRVRFSFEIGRKVVYGSDSSTNASVLLVMSVISNSSTVPSPGFIAGYTIVRFSDA